MNRQILLPGDGMKSQAEKFLQAVEAVVEEGWKQGVVRVHSVHQHLAMSRASLYRKMKKITGSGPNEWIREKQLNRAAQFLANDWGNVSEAAYTSGFNNLSYFSKCFKQRFGCPPHQYRPRPEVPS